LLKTNFDQAITVLVFLEQYQPRMLPQISILKIRGKIIPFKSKPLNNGLPMKAFTTTHNQRVGKKPNKIPFKTVGFFTSKVKIRPQIPPLIIKRMAAINSSPGGLEPM